MAQRFEAAEDNGAVVFQSPTQLDQLFPLQKRFHHPLLVLELKFQLEVSVGNGVYGCSIAGQIGTVLARRSFRVCAALDERTQRSDFFLKIERKRAFSRYMKRVEAFDNFRRHLRFLFKELLMARVELQVRKGEVNSSLRLCLVQRGRLCRKFSYGRFGRLMSLHQIRTFPRNEEVRDSFLQRRLGQWRCLSGGCGDGRLEHNSSCQRKTIKKLNSIGVNFRYQTLSVDRDIAVPHRSVPKRNSNPVQSHFSSSNREMSLPAKKKKGK